MATEHFELDKHSEITVVSCGGDLTVRPWLQLDARAIGEYEAEVAEGHLRFVSTDDLVINLPEAYGIYVQKVKGDAFVRSLNGKVVLENVSGDLILGNLAQVMVTHISGDLVAKNISGALTLQRVDGDIVVRNVDGDLSCELINGDAALQYISGAVRLDTVIGDVSARAVNGELTIVEGHRDANLRDLGGRCHVEVEGDIRMVGGLGPFEHKLMARGDVVLSWPVEAPLLLEAQASQISNRLPLLDTVVDEGRLVGRLGEGKTRLQIEADGKLVLKETQMVSKKWGADNEPAFDFDFASELGELGNKLSAEINEQVARVTSELETNFGPDFMQRMAEQFSQRAGAAAKKAQKAAEKVAAQQTAERQSQSSQGDASQNRQATSQEAQLKILRMVESGAITPDEASMLLQALEGD